MSLPFFTLALDGNEWEKSCPFRDTRLDLPSRRPSLYRLSFPTEL
jgi:hypothetical protein